MGGGNSKESQLSKYGQLLTDGEKKALHDCFNDIAGSFEADNFIENDFKMYIDKSDLKCLNSKQMFMALSVRSPDGITLTPPNVQVTFSSFIQNVSWLIKGSHDQRSRLFNHLIPQPVSLECVQSLLKIYLATIFAHCENKCWSANDDTLQLLIDQLTHPLKANVTPQGTLDKMDISIWLVKASLTNSIIQWFFTSIFLTPYTTNQSLDDSILPCKIIHPILKVDFDSQLLDQATILFLHSSLSDDVRGFIYPLFSTKTHGLSYSTLCRQILDVGPTLIIVRDTNGHVFGGVTGCAWKFTPQFIGYVGCFLFTLHPSIAVYMPTGYNDNYMYLQQTAQSLPNGLGMGGQVGYFGFWLSADFGRGHSKAHPKCSTFGSPCLSSGEEFEIDMMEVWGLGEPRLPEDFLEVSIN
jgi:hypothetical protein